MCAMYFASKPFKTEILTHTHPVSLNFSLCPLYINKPTQFDEETFKALRFFAKSYQTRAMVDQTCGCW